MRKLLPFLLLALLLCGLSPAYAQATYFQNFDTTTVGSLPPNWVNINTPVTSTGQVVAGSTLSAPNMLSLSGAGDGQTVLYTGGTAVADGAYQISYLYDSNRVPCLVARSDAAGANYYLALIQSNTVQWYKRVSGSFTALGTVAIGTSFGAGNLVTAKLKVQGSTLSLKLWAYGSAEPAAYQQTLTDASITAPGYGGVRFAYPNGAAPAFDDFYAGGVGAATFTPPAGVSVAASPASLMGGTSGNAVTLSGAGTAWTGGTTFSVSSTGAGAAITAQSVNAGTQTATLTVTAGSAGTLTYADSADAATASQSVTAPPPATILMTDTNLLAGRSPYNWAGGQMLSAGAYLKGVFSYTTSGALTVSLNTANYGGIAAGSRPCIAWSVDGGPRQTLLLSDANLTGAAPSQSVTLAGSLAAGAHSLNLWLKNVDPHIDQWTTPLETVNVVSFGGPSGTTTTPTPLRPTRVYFRGDSITDGEGVLAPIGSGSDWGVSGDATVAWPALVAGALNAEYGQVGYGGAGWGGASAGGVPALSSSWTSLYSGVPRLSGGLLSPVPTHVITNMGTNGQTTGTLATSGSTGTARADMAALRAASGASCLDLYLVPFGQFARAGLLNDLSYYGGGTTATNGYTALAVGTSTVYKANSDPNTWVVDLGAAASAGLSVINGPATFQAYDGTHPSQATDAQLAALIAQAAQGGVTPAPAASLPAYRGQIRRGR